MNYLKLIRYKNLLMIALMQLIVHFGFLKQQGIGLAMSDFQAVLLAVATVLIAAGGYVINNVLDIATDLENKPGDVVVGNGISEERAYNLYFGLTITGVALGFYLSYEIERWNFSMVFILVAMTLYLYANSLKRMLLVGNVVIALLTGISVLVVGIFDLVPTLFYNDKSMVATIMGVLLDYAIFTCLVNLIREIVKDLEDVNGDYNQGMNTLPIALGIGRTTKIASVLGVMAFVTLSWYVYQYLFQLTYTTLYALVFLISPLVFFSIRIWSAKKQKEFSSLSLLLKIVLFLGILSIAVLTFNMKYNA
ncbi:geranylgeranylglycerol-phosphate geranylgeranyltransferase [Flavobacterium selenitireducens]|uniref:geranylgeranylglycerol-phosphate geranylgeranyltransferase n=1 Tax=Flavobacterium selenitireducens TaxID=2722704 RepID=UPI00168A4C55|nr:geranylgeranylglycerol-phosphate geranylgeranyltransferase [Flavobacterium selenitireducens]MBD3581094.1 UbiA family prenyltransferase [Flavobacterium selenitireducens]